MNKKTQMWIGVVAVAAIAVWLYNRSQNQKASFAGRRRLGAKPPKGTKYQAGNTFLPASTKYPNGATWMMQITYDKFGNELIENTRGYWAPGQIPTGSQVLIGG